MSIINKINSIVSVVSGKYGRYVGKGKNNGIRVYSKLENDGSKFITSVDENGKICKQIKKIQTQETFFGMPAVTYYTRIKYPIKDEFVIIARKKIPNAVDGANHFSQEESVARFSGSYLQDVKKFDKIV